ncbi:MAG: transposase [Armatimonadetes bacterium]|nr:transposase [Armatimonadota bacterium]
MSDYKHYVNPKGPGQLCFVTATCLDFAHLFAREEVRTRMCLSLLRDCKRWRASLFGYVVMPHHIHLVVRPDASQTISALVKEIKGNASDRLKAFLTSHEREQLHQQAGLGRNNFWKRSFRGNPLYTNEVLEQKVRYLNDNPVRAGYVSDAGEYVWSSLYIVRHGFILEDESVDLSKSLEFYRELLSPSS